MIKKYIFFLLFFTTISHAKLYDKLEFKGNGIDFLVGTFSSSNLYKVIGKPYPPFYTPWRSDPKFDDRDIQKYEKHLIDYFNSYGFYRVKINSKVLKDKIIINIIKNKPIKITSIKFYPTKSLKRFLPLRVGDIFTTDKFKESKKILQRKLLEEGYPKYSFDAKAYVDLDNYIVKLDYHVDKNISVKLGKTIIDGRGDVDEDIIKEAITYKKGDIYDIRKLEKTYDKIYEYGVYDYITIEPELDKEKNISSVPVDIKLKMGDTKFVKNSIGYNTDTGFRGTLSWIDKNFFGNLKVFDIGLSASKLGYQIYNVFYNPRIIIPYLHKIDFKNEINYHLTHYDSYDERGLVNRLTFGKKIGKIEHYFGLLTELSKIKSKIADTSKESGSYFLNSIFYRLLIDKRDSKVDANDGYYLSLYLEKSDKVLGSNLNYFKTIGEFRYIKSFLNKRAVIAFKTRIGRIDRYVPSFKRFYTGGSFTNRGYEFQQLGKKDSSSVPYGGLSLIDLISELRYKFFKKLYGVLFYDSSMLSMDTNKFNDKFYDSYGFGFRYITPIGPLRVDFGFPRDENNWHFHVSIGEIF